MTNRNYTPPGLSQGKTRKFRVNKTQSYNKRRTYNNNNNTNNKYEQNKYKNKRDNIFLLTRDNYYFILEKKYVKNADFFKNLFQSDCSAGHLRNPIYLQKVDSIYFKFIIQYLKRYEGIKHEKFEMENIISINELYHHYEEEWDKDFIKEVLKKFETEQEDFVKFLEMIQYIGVFNMYRKVKFAYDFVENIKAYGLDDLDSELDCISSEIEDDEEEESDIEEIDY